MKTKKSIVSLVIAALVCGSVYAREDINAPHAPKRVLANGCVQDQGSAFLNINNVRARIMDEGDMWWNPAIGGPQYFVPNASPTCSQFAGSLWIGGLDAGGQLKIAAMTYRQNGEDFWAGPLDTATVSITVAECQAYDKLFAINRQEVQNFVSHPNNAQYLTPDILNWPGNGNQVTYGEAKFLAPFRDLNGDGIYEPQLGEYPDYDLQGNFPNCTNELFGDQTLWWVINDEGNIHSETGGLAIGLEIRCQAFEFSTNDAINNCTFYNYQIINRSSYQINKTYFGAWDDPDLGNGADDFVGCDVGRGLGYCYNGNNYDADGGGPFADEKGYHGYPPAIGVDFFQGPRADAHDTDCYVQNGLIGMARFVYYKNDFSVTGNPQNATHYYNYLKGLWTDGTPMTYGGTGYQSSSTATNYMYPWTPSGATQGGSSKNTDPTGCGTNHVIQNTVWDMFDIGFIPNDMRFLQSAGPFTLKPGAVNFVTTGDVWDQSATANNAELPVGLIQVDDDQAQALFNNCFKVLEGPDAPDLTVQELNREIIITLSNPSTSNNYKEGYKQRSPTIVPPYKDTDYVFEGYQLFQVLDSAVTATQLQDPSKARLVAECDIKNGVGQLVNYTFNQALGGNVPSLMVSGSDKGILHSFDIKSDQFQTDNITGLVNDRPYYFMCIAYAYNNFSTYNPLGPDSLLNGQKLPYLQGQKSAEGQAVQVYKAVPHIPSAQGYGTVQNSQYGEGPAITRIEGHGNGTNTIELNQASIDYILANDTMAHPTYVGSQGPIKVEIVDPLSVPAGNFIVKVLPNPITHKMDSTCRWMAYRPGIDTIYSDTNISVQNQQIAASWGLSIQIQTVDLPGTSNAPSNGAIDSTSNMTFADPTKQWLSGLQTSTPGTTPTFWIRSGTYVDKSTPAPVAFSSYAHDPNNNYQQMVNGTWSPYYLTCQSDAPKLYVDYGPKSNGPDLSSLNTLSSVDVVITSDKSKWTRCPVLEEQDEPALAQGGAAKLALRKSPSIDQDGNYATLGSGASGTVTDRNYIADNGMGWFPGYAINIETGERLNMAYGEDSWLVNDGGRDMKWNPDSIVFKQDGSGATGVSQFFGISSIMGGKHYIYVFGHNAAAFSVVPPYDGGDTLYHVLKRNVVAQVAHMWSDAMWVNIPLLVTGHNLLETDVTIHLRVAKPYAVNWGAKWSSPSPDNGNFPMYSFGTNGLEVETNVDSTAKDALRLINIVPNPYYAYSSYESDKIDTRVRITNLPPVCTISIFTLNGTLVNVINKEGPLTYIDWNLENSFNVPIASGMYIINVNVPNVGSKTLKWFGVMRPLDLNSY